MTGGPGGRVVGSVVAALIDIGFKLSAAYVSVKFIVEQ